MEEFNDEKFIDNYPFQASIETIENILIQMKRSVCKIYNGREKGTGFFCKIHNNNQKKDIKVLITNNHVLGKNYFNKKKKIEISLDDENKMENININEKVFIFTDEKLDITFVEIDENNSINKYVNYLEIDYKVNHEKEHYANLFGKKPIYTMHYPEGKKILVSYGIFKSIDIDSNFIKHTCSTDNGSSGAPILLLDSLKVIGVHMGYDQYSRDNKGIFMKNTISEFLEHFKENNLNIKVKEEKVTKIQSFWRGRCIRKIMILYYDLEEFLFLISRVCINHFIDNFFFFINQLFNINSKNYIKIYNRNNNYKNIENNQNNSIRNIKNFDYSNKNQNIVYEKKNSNNYFAINKQKNKNLNEISNIPDKIKNNKTNIYKTIDEPNKKRNKFNNLLKRKPNIKPIIKNQYCDTEYKLVNLIKYPAQSYKKIIFENKNENKDLEYQQTQYINYYDTLKINNKIKRNNNNYINNIPYNLKENNIGNNNYNLNIRNSNINDNYINKLKNRERSHSAKDDNYFNKFWNI